jgi:hypothetical protein
MPRTSAHYPGVCPDKLCDKEFTLSGAGGFMTPPMNGQLLLAFPGFIVFVHL